MSLEGTQNPIMPHDIIGETQQYDKFRNFLEESKQYLMPIYFRHNIDEYILEESTISITIDDSKVILCCEGVMHDIDIATRKPFVTPIKNHMELTMINIDQMIDNAHLIRDNIRCYFKYGEPTYYMPSGICYALFEFMERHGLVPKL